MTTSSTLRRRLVVTAISGAVAATAVGVAVGAASQGATHASAVLHDTSGAAVGVATITEDANGVVHVNVKVSGLTPGEHGIHFHGIGACSPDFAAAGSHHNPTGAPHGNHGGDLPNLTVNAAGRGTLNAKTERATLTTGPLSLFDADGAAIVIHAAPDDFVTQPTGNSGARIACGELVAG